MAAEARNWVFVSSENRDRARADKLLTVLQDRGVQVRRYENAIRPGLGSWDAVMDAVRDEAGAALVIWSELAAESALVAKEASAAAEAGMLVAALLDGPDFVPAGFEAVPIVDLEGWDGDDSDPRLDRLVADLTDAATRRAELRRTEPRRDLPDLSTSVSTLRDRLGAATAVTALDIVQELAVLHPEYGAGGLGLAILDGFAGGLARPVDDWLRLARRSFYLNRPSASGDIVRSGSGTAVLHGRVLLVALADADETVRAALGDPLLLAVQRELEAPGVHSAARSPEPTPTAEAQPEPELAGHVDSDLVVWDGQRKLEDKLDVSIYVKMLATVVASRDTPMPLSIGLFGEWGSGKSYFMGLLQQEIRALGSQAGHDGSNPFCSAVVSVHFNAWHYADANLWASLAVQVFEKLARSDEEEAAGEATARQSLLIQLQTYKEAEAALRAERDRAEQSYEAARTALKQARAQEHDARAELRAETARDVPTTVANDERVKPLLDTLNAEIKELGLGTDAGIADLPRVVGELKAASLDIARIWQIAKKNDPKRATRVAVMAVVFGLIGLTLLALPGAIRALGAPWVAGAFGALTWLLRSGSQAVAPLRKALSDAENTMRVADRAWEVAEQRRRQTIEALQRRVADAQAEQQELARRLSEAEADVLTTKADIQALEAGPRLYRFIAERAASNDYRKQLGIVSLIRQDFEELTRRLRKANAASGSNGDVGRGGLERIVLYIDDLDRCPPERVVQVLEAVHLLLAMDLFVVVVGVDPRWLLRSLQRQFRELLTFGHGEDDGYWRSTPQNYLEKIFQIPFVLPAMTGTGFTTLLESLVRPPSTNGFAADAEVSRPTTTAGTPTPSASESPEIVPQEGSALERVASGKRVPPLDLQREEVTFLALLAPLVRTPRAAKRMVNVYRMLRVTKDLRPASTFLGRPDAAGEYQAVAQLLGVLTGSPALLGAIFWGAAADPLQPAADPHEPAAYRGLASRDDEDSWNDFVDALAPRPVGSDAWENAVDAHIAPSAVDDWRSLVAALQSVRPALTLADRLRPYRRWALPISRFSFEMSRFAGAAQTDAPPPGGRGQPSVDRGVA